MRKSFILPESRPHYPPDRPFLIEHIAIELEVDFPRKAIRGTCTLAVKPVSPGHDKIVLDACGMEVGSVEVDGRSTRFDYDGERLTVRTPPMSSGAHLVKVEYSTTPKDGIYFIGPDEKYQDKPVQAWAHSEAEFARHWFPCIDQPGVKFTSETVIAVPQGYTVVSNGKLVSTTSRGNSVIYHWKEDAPHSSYLTSFVAGKFSLVEDEVDGVPLQYYVPESKKQDVGRYFGETARMVKLFGEITGVKYPFAKYAQTTVEDFIFGGMENVDATTLTTNRFHDAQSDEDFQTSYGVPNRGAYTLVAHELAHQWFGNLVTCSDWSHAWLNEGFADYMQLLYTERTRSWDDARWDMLLTSGDVFSEDESRYRRPIVDRNYVYPDDMFDETLYKKGAWMIHELRHVLGDDSFFRGINLYLRTFANANADTHDFRRAMEEASGLSLERFFDQSFFKAGYPEFEVAYDWEEAARLATVSVRQVQATDAETPIFQLPCDIAFNTSGGRRSKRVWIRRAEQSFSFELDSEPSTVEFDPEGWLLKKVSFPKPVRMLMSQLNDSPAASSRADAARQLGEMKAEAAVAALKASAAKPQFWHVSASALQALGRIGTPEALAALISIDRPSHRRTRRALAEALGNFKDERAAAALVSMLSSDQSPYVRCEAAISLAKSAGLAALPPLKEAMKAKSPNDALAEACLDAMGRIGGEEARSIVRESLEYGKPTRVRIGALKAIKERGRILDDEVPVLKQILLADSEFQVRDYIVAKLLPVVPDRRMLEALATSSKTDRDNRVRRSALEAIHEMTSDAALAGTVAELKGDVDSLKRQIASPVPGPRDS